jgi:predicted RecA/RadA family phage recombinase
MATARFIHDGDAIDYTPGSDVAAGDVVVQEDLIGVAKLDIPVGRLGALSVTGVFDFPKATGSGTSIPAGATVYWDDTAQQAFYLGAGSASGNELLLGKAELAAGETDATVRVRLTQ